MAFTDEKHVVLRNAAEKVAHSKGVPVRWVKAQLKTLYDDVDSWLEGEKPTISAVMDTSVPALSLTNAEKKWLFGVYMGVKFPQEIE